MKIYIKENSIFARMAAIKLNKPQCAIVIRSTIYLHNTSTESLLENTAWLRHEVCHGKQWKEQGALLFLLKYVYWSIRYGYFNNPFEIAARKAQEDNAMLQGVLFA